jgi:hypothetical protein
MFSILLKNMMSLLLVLTFIGQTTASTLMSCEMEMAKNIEQNNVETEPMTSLMNSGHAGVNSTGDAKVNVENNHDCCDEEFSASSEQQCGDNCQCLIGGCSALFIPEFDKLSGNIPAIHHVKTIQFFEPRSQYLSFLYRPPIIS